MLILVLLIILPSIGAQNDDYFEELKPSKFKFFGPFRDPPIQFTTDFPDNETSSSDGIQIIDEDNLVPQRSDHSMERTTETTSVTDNAFDHTPSTVQSPNNCQVLCQPECSVPQPCTCAAPKPLCIPRPPPLCPPPPLPLICPPPACPRPAPCPPCIQIPAMPLPCICPPPIYEPAPQNDCCCNCKVPCKTTRHSKVLMFGTKIREFDESLSRCNNQEIRQIIAENISTDLEESKYRITTAAQRGMGIILNIICGHGEFSYVVQTRSYCQYSIGYTTCYAFQSI